MHPITARLRLALLTLALIGALALTGVIVNKPHGLAGAVPGTIGHGWSIAYLCGGKHLDEITLALVPRKAGTGPLEY